MLDFLRKETVKEFTFTNAGSGRNFEKKVLVNGHRTTMLCAEPLAVMVGVLYEVWDPSVESFKYVLNIGIGEQDLHENVEPIIGQLNEKAALSMLMNPVITLKFDDNPLENDNFDFDLICQMYLTTRKKKAMMSLEEVHDEMKRDSYGKKYPYDWAYFKIYRRMEFNG